MWCASDDDSLASMTNTHGPLSPDLGYIIPGIHGPQALAIDPSGNVWMAGSYDDNFNTVITETIGAAAPVVTPISLGVKNHTLGTRP